jgi:hypothetical protein
MEGDATGNANSDRKLNGLLDLVQRRFGKRNQAWGYCLEASYHCVHIIVYVYYEDHKSLRRS